MPDISGKWTGTAQSTFVDDDGSKTKEMVVTAVVVQTFTSVSVRFTPETGTSTSYSVAANFVHDPEAQRIRLVYTYTNEPKVNESHLDKHFGTVILEIEGTPPNRMHGFYMTDRKTQTKGDLELFRDS